MNTKLFIIEGNEFRAVTQEVTFGPGQSSLNITIPIIDDSIPQEPDVTFTVSIIPNPSILPPEDDPEVTVVDDDGKQMLSALLYMVTAPKGDLD